jgi:hypothetical protein
LSRCMASLPLVKSARRSRGSSFKLFSAMPEYGHIFPNNLLQIGDASNGRTANAAG